MKTLLNTIIAAVLFIGVVNTAEAGKVKIFSSVDETMSNDKQVARTLRGFTQDGYTEVSRSMQYINYFAACTSDCKWGTYTVVMNIKVGGEYSLETKYAYIHFNMNQDFETGGFYVESSYVEEMMTY